MVIRLIQYRNSRVEDIKRAAIRQRTALQTSAKYFTFAKYPSGIFKKKMQRVDTQIQYLYAHAHVNHARARKSETAHISGH